MAASSRQPGSDRGRASIDWERAFLYYAALPADERSYRAVASEFAVSVRTVEKHGRRDNWRERAQAIEADATAAAAAELSAERAARLLEVEKLIDATHLAYAQELRRGAIRPVPADLPRLHKLRQELWSTEANTQLIPRPDATRPANPATTERKLEVLRALHDAGALARLQQLVEADPDPEAAAPEDDEDEGATP